MSKSSGPKLYLVRHGWAEHNVNDDYDILDPDLTETGRNEAKNLCEEFEKLNLPSDTLVVASPLRRAVETALLSCPHKKPILHAELVECSSSPCDTCNPINVRGYLEKGLVDGSVLGDDFMKTISSLGTEPLQLAQRATRVRTWLRKQTNSTIVVVSHGAFLRYLVNHALVWGPWDSGEARIYQFPADGSDNLEAAPMTARL